MGCTAGWARPWRWHSSLGVGLPFLWGWEGGGNPRPVPDLLIIVGALLTLAFVALAFLIALLFEDRAKGLGAPSCSGLALPRSMTPS